MKDNRSIPKATVVPVLIYPDVRQAVEWLGAAFGFVECVRIGENHRAQLGFGDGALIVGDDARRPAGAAPGESPPRSSFASTTRTPTASGRASTAR